MSRRLSKRSNLVDSYAEIDENETLITTSPGRKRTPKKKTTPSRKGLEIAVDEHIETTKRETENNSVKVEEVEPAIVATVVKNSPGKRKREVKAEEINAITAAVEAEGKKKVKVKSKRKVEAEEEDIEEGGEKKVKKKRKTKEEKEAEMVPLAARTSVHTLKRAIYIGAHVSAAGGNACSYIPWFLLSCFIPLPSANRSAWLRSP